MNKGIEEKIKRVRLLILDVDGVLTNGSIVLDEQGKEIKFFNVLDGFGIVLFRRLGYKTAILSARKSEAVSARASDLKIDKVCQDAYPKINVYKELLGELGFSNEEVCFVGDDLPDVEVLKEVGFAVTVTGACSEVQEVTDYVTENSGGGGAVREVIELILKIQGRWSEALESCGV